MPVTNVFVSDEIVTAAKLNANVSPVVHARVTDLTGSGISTSEAIEATANLTIPVAWLGYDLEASVTCDLRETGTLTAPRVIEGRIRLTNAAGTLMGYVAQVMDSAAITTQRWAMSVNGYLTGQTATGTVPVVFTCQLSGDSGQASVASIIMLVKAWRTS